MFSQDDFNELLTTQLNMVSNMRIKQYITNIWVILENRRKTNNTCFSLTSIAEELKSKQQGPRLQTLYNNTGYDYSRFIKNYKEILNNNQLKKRKPDIFDTINEIPNVSVREILTQKIKWAIEIEKENTMLRSTFKELTISCPNNPVQEKSITLKPTVDRNMPLYLRDAIKKAIDKERLEERNLIIKEDGSINQGSLQLFPPGFMTALYFILEKL